jgi:hypothetical protein
LDFVQIRVTGPLVAITKFEVTNQNIASTYISNHTSTIFENKLYCCFGYDNTKNPTILDKPKKTGNCFIFDFQNIERPSYEGNVVLKGAQSEPFILNHLEIVAS